MSQQFSSVGQYHDDACTRWRHAGSDRGCICNLVIVRHGAFMDGKATPSYQVARYDVSDGAYHFVSSPMTLERAREIVGEGKVPNAAS